jgi:hypothetical protein
LAICWLEVVYDVDKSVESINPIFEVVWFPFWRVVELSRSSGETVWAVEGSFDVNQCEMES